MSSIEYNTLATLRPVKLNYTYSATEPLITQQTSYDTGLNVNFLQGTSQFQDVTFNNETCLVLTSSVNLSAFFSTKLFENNFFGSVHLKSRNSDVYYVAYNKSLNSLYLSTSASHIYISPVPETNEVELIVERKYVQVEENYPYNVVLNERSFDPESSYRQRFICVVQNNTVSFKTRTNTGYRYLGFCDDGALRATGTVLNNTAINDYVFNIEYIAVNTGVHGFVPVNEYVTYYFDFEDSSNNKNINVNKALTNNPNNFLLSFTFEDVADNNTNINIANLKNIITPAGGISTIDNSYTKLAPNTN